MSSLSTNYLFSIGSAICGVVAYTVTGSPRLGGGIAFLIWTIAERCLSREGPIRTLPSELIGRIANFLPPNDLGHSLQVNSQWNSSIANDPTCKISMMLAEAKQIALQEQDPFKRDKLLLKIVKVEALHDLAGAKDTTWQMRYRFSGDQAFLEIVKVEVQHDLVEAKATAKQMHWHKNHALLEIVKVEALHDLAGAKITAEQIQNPSIKDKALLKIVEVEARRNLRSATIIAKVDPQHDLSQAGIIAEHTRALEQPINEPVPAKNVQKARVEELLNTLKKRSEFFKEIERTVENLTIFF